MKKFAIFLAASAAVICSLDAAAQYRTEDENDAYANIGEVYRQQPGKTTYTYYNPLERSEYSRPTYKAYKAANYVGRGQGLVDAGKALMYTGAGFAVSGLATFIYGEATFVQSECCPTMPVYPIFAIAQGIAGAVLAVVGVPLYFFGRADMNESGANQIVYGGDASRGWAVFCDVSLGIPNFAGLSVQGGYNFSNWFFLGGGLGYKLFLSNGLIQDGGISASAPLYAATKFSFGKMRTVPYVGINAGYDLLYNSWYAGFDAGARIKTIRGTRGQSWWIGCALDFSPDYEFISLKVSKSF